MNPINETEIHFNKEGKIALLMPLMYSIGKEGLLDKNLFKQIDGRLLIVKPKISQTELSEQITWAIVCIKKYNIELDHAHQLICECKTIDYCFDKFVEAGGLDELTEPLDPSITKH